MGTLASRENCGIESYTGRFLYPLRPRSKDVDIQDVAHALSNKCRYTGHCREFYSVAQHSVLVSEFVDRDLALAGLLHDASEYLLPDVATPLKPFIPGFKEMEEAVLDAVYKRFGIIDMRYDEDIQAAVKAADMAVMAIEVRDLMPGDSRWWTLPEPDPYRIVVPQLPIEAKKKFLARFYQILDQMPELLEHVGMV